MGSRKGMLGGLLLIIGAILLVVSLLVGWYVFTAKSNFSESFGGTSFSGSSTSTVTLSLGSNYQLSGTSTVNGVSASQSRTCAYAGNSTCPAEKNVSSLYSAGEYIVVGGVALGFLGGILALMGGSRPGMRKIGMVFGVVALLLAIAAPMTLLAAQPGAFKSDEGNAYMGNGTGPDHTYFGSCSGSSCGSTGVPGGSNTTGNWGPSTGWYLSIVGFVILLLGVIMSRRGTEPAAAPTPAPVAPMDSSMGAPPPANPPMGSS
ncbi:MAG: hypothetical protein L3K11_08195 [Thermoplasmata archaeon]|nr:hypothetical protein [Thermoplasmata archaeon]